MYLPKFVRKICINLRQKSSASFEITVDCTRNNFEMRGDSLAPPLLQVSHCLPLVQQINIQLFVLILQKGRRRHASQTIKLEYMCCALLLLSFYSCCSPGLGLTCTVCQLQKQILILGDSILHTTRLKTSWDGFATPYHSSVLCSILVKIPSCCNCMYVMVAWP